MSRDEEDTWNRKLRGMSSDDRALQSSSRRRTRTPALAVPIRDDSEEPTSPHDLMERPVDADEDRLATRLRRDTDDPIKTLSEAISKLTHRLDRVQRESESGVRDQHKQLEELLKGPKRAPSWLTIGTFATLAGLVVGMAGFLYSRGASEEAQRMRIDYLERRLEETRSDAKDQRPRWPLPIIKDPSP